MELWERADWTRIWIAGITEDSIVDGPGIRITVFVQGCTHRCFNCQNPQTQPREGGEEFRCSELVDMIKEHGKLADGITISGGEPFEQAHACAVLASALRKEGFNVWVYSGYIYEVLRDSKKDEIHELLDNCDVLVDGAYVEGLKSYDLDWRGSTNQRIIELNKNNPL